MQKSANVCNGGVRVASRTPSIAPVPQPGSRVNVNVNQSKIQNDNPQNEFREVLRKVMVLLIANVVISIILAMLMYRDLKTSAVASDMLVSNVCLWLLLGFNQKLYWKFCKPCINCSHMCCT